MPSCDLRQASSQAFCWALFSWACVVGQAGCAGESLWYCVENMARASTIRFAPACFPFGTTISGASQFSGCSVVPTKKNKRKEKRKIRTTSHHLVHLYHSSHSESQGTVYIRHSVETPRPSWRQTQIRSHMVAHRGERSQVRCHFPHQCDEPRGCISAGRACSQRDDTPNRAARVPDKEYLSLGTARGARTTLTSF